MSDFEKLNAQFETAPRTFRKIAYIFIIVLSVALFLMSLLLLLASPIAGIIGIIFSVILFFFARSELKALKKNNKTPKDLLNITQQLCKQPSDTDAAPKQEPVRNNKQDFNKSTGSNFAQKILETCDSNVTGVMKLQNGINPQTLIHNMHIGDKIILIADPQNKYDDSAVKVCNFQGVQVGWLPKGSIEQLEVFDQLIHNEPVFSSVKKIYAMDRYPGSFGLVIDISYYIDADEYEDDDEDDEEY